MCAQEYKLLSACRRNAKDSLRTQALGKQHSGKGSARLKHATRSAVDPAGRPTRAPSHTRPRAPALPAHMSSSAAAPRYFPECGDLPPSLESRAAARLDGLDADPDAWVALSAPHSARKPVRTISSQKRCLQILL